MSPAEMCSWISKIFTLIYLNWIFKMANVIVAIKWVSVWRNSEMGAKWKREILGLRVQTILTRLVIKKNHFWSHNASHSTSTTKNTCTKITLQNESYLSMDFSGLAIQEVLFHSVMYMVDILKEQQGFRQN